MNLRHIDPRSSDWMDAMMEGDKEGEVELEKTEPAPHTVMMAAGGHGGTPPGQRPSVHGSTDAHSSR